VHTNLLHGGGKELREGEPRHDRSGRKYNDPGVSVSLVSSLGVWNGRRGGGG